ncbi:MAG: GGDEF domain-containing protein [Lachnospiraceae bacterium]|nr:GGDEF domain-containing protein [Lachnospiraceae bacterium]
MNMTVELFDSIINTSQDCVFWKDSERRFLGVNQAFLDFYGFESADVLIGKTDEDMGWHSDPEPFRQDELRVLSGRSTYKVQGKCVIRGEERDIIASKRPLYEGDNIVGLVGSFVDITEVLRRRNGLDSAQVVYPIEKLRKYDYFDHIIDEISLDEILDPLTGVLSRSYSMKFVNHLIHDHIPFTFAMIDLDNFKFINDSFGHVCGDLVLKHVSKGLAEAAEGIGLVGRFGGDELLLVNLRDTDMEGKTSFFEKLYTGSEALRHSIDFGIGSALITATSGCATFPADADNFNDLFGLIDKMLYLGKGRGRDCFTIYKKDEHQDIEIAQIAKRGIFGEMKELRIQVNRAEGLVNKLKAAMPYIGEMLQVKDMYYVTADGRMRSVMNPAFEASADDIGCLMKEDVFAERTLERVEKETPVFYRALTDNGLSSALIMRFGADTDGGYLICAVERSYRIWQENECAILYYLTGLLG